jgi:hypothetical protein
MRFLTSAVLVACIGQAVALSADERSVTSEQQACETLKRAAIEFCLSRRNLEGRYYCDPLPEQQTHYVLGLRYKVTPDELVGSNLIGWFGVRKADGKVFGWDITEDQPRPLVPHCPFEHG